MDLTKFNYPEPTFALGTDKELLAEAERRGFLHGHTPYNDKFNALFFGGGSVKLKEGIDGKFKGKAFPYLKALMGSFSPKHEHKEAVCAMLLSELIEL